MTRAMFDYETFAAAQRIIRLCAERKLTIATAESCTGGWAAAAVTATAGSSNWFERGFVCYSNEAKQEMLHVPAETLLAHGAVSEETAREMAEGAVRNSDATAAISITGIAGPTGGSPAKPVGLVHFAAAFDGQETVAAHYVFPGDRDDVRLEAAMPAMRSHDFR